MTDSAESAMDDELADTTDGSRDPLSTDDGLAAAAADMPAVDAERPVDDLSGAQSEGDPVDLPDLQVDAGGHDPLSTLAAGDA